MNRFASFCLKHAHGLILLLQVVATPAAAQGLEAHPRIRPAGPLTVQAQEHEGIAAMRARAEGGMTGDDRLVHLPVPELANGTMTGLISGQPVPRATAGARGFVGIAFRVQDDDRYQAFYIRPANGRSDDQVRRNRSTQYISHPEFTWERLRAENPGMYESYADMEPGKWVPFRIEVDGPRARLFLGNSIQPVLIVNELKQGTNKAGGVALWIGPETDAYFADIRVVRGD